MCRRSAADTETMPRRRLVRALLLLVLGVVLVALAFSIDLNVDDAASADGKAVAEVAAVARAEAGGGTEAAATAVFALLDQATAQGRTAGGTLLLRGLPGRADYADEQAAAAHRSVAAVTVTTRTGATCRRAVLDLTAREQALYVALRAGLDSDGDAWTAVDRFAVGSRALKRWWRTRAERCVASADTGDRAAVRRLLATVA
jgi:hypothetical protein